MARPTKFRLGDNQFPIICEEGNIRIYKNPAGELFVEELLPNGGGVTLRFNPSSRCGLQFTTNELVEPEIVGSMIGWHITRR